jgi:hypothetical protein
MWCIGRITEEYRTRMYDLRHLYNVPYREKEPVVCLDEKSKQLLKNTHGPLPAKPGMPAKEDDEYQRAGTCNLFVAVEPKGKRRLVEVTERRAKSDFVGFVKMLLEQVYVSAREVAAWQQRRNAERRGIEWTFTRQDADRKLARHYVS